DNASKSLDKLIGSQIPDKSRKGLGFVSYNVVPPPPIGLFSPPNLNLSYFSLEEFQQPKFEGYGPKSSKSISEDISNEVRESSDAPLVKELVSDDKLEEKTIFSTVAKIDFVRAKQQEKPVRKPVKYAEMYSFNHVQTNCNYHQRERVVSGNNYKRVNYNYSTKKAHPSAHRNMAPIAVLMKTGLRPLNTARPVNTAHLKTTVYSARPMSHFSKSAQSTGYPQKEDQGYVNSGCSRHMTWNMSYLSDFKEFDEGYICQELVDESQFYLKSLQERTVLIKNIVPKECLTCLVAKATLDESMLWHRRLGHWIRKLKNIKCDIGTEFKNRVMSEFCEKKGIKKEFSIARTPQQNGVTERRNRTLIKAARTMLADFKLPTTFWAEAVNTACYVQNRNASNDEPQPSSDTRKKDDEGVNKESRIDDQERPENSTQDILLLSRQSGVQTRRMIKTIYEQGFISAIYEGKTHEDLHTCLFACFLSQEEPKKVIQALKDSSWIEAMQEELLQFKLQQVGTLWIYHMAKEPLVLKCVQEHSETYERKVLPPGAGLKHSCS
ncbi:putative ribonuclease H-like domain-containing protein, partial [Tanacetum coccineum]